MERKKLHIIIVEIVQQMVNDPKAIIMRHQHTGDTHIIDVTLPKGDIGKVLGKGGKTANCIRTIISCIAASRGEKCMLMFYEESKGPIS